MDWQMASLQFYKYYVSTSSRWHLLSWSSSCMNYPDCVCFLIDKSKTLDWHVVFISACVGCTQLINAAIFCHFGLNIDPLFVYPSFFSPPLPVYAGVYMVGAKGARGPPGPPGKCSCSSLSSPPFENYASTGNYLKVPAVRDEWFAVKYRIICEITGKSTKLKCKEFQRVIQLWSEVYISSS